MNWSLQWTFAPLTAKFHYSVSPRYYVSSLEVVIITYTLGVKCCLLKR